MTVSLVDSSVPLGYYKIVQVGGATVGNIGNLSVAQGILPAKEAYLLDTHHDSGFIDIHKVLIGDANGDGHVEYALWQPGECDVIGP